LQQRQRQRWFWATGARRHRNRHRTPIVGIAARRRGVERSNNGRSVDHRYIDHRVAVIEIGDGVADTRAEHRVADVEVVGRPIVSDTADGDQFIDRHSGYSDTVHRAEGELRALQCRVDQRRVNQHGVNQHRVNQRRVNQRRVNQRRVNQQGVDQHGVDQHRTAFRRTDDFPTRHPVGGGTQDHPARRAVFGEHVRRGWSDNDAFRTGRSAEARNSHRGTAQDR
jgi:hypothetical protein